MNLIRAAWVLAPVAAVVYGVWFWPNTPEGQEQARKNATIKFADDACAIVTVTADTGQQRLDAAISCQKFKDAARRETPPMPSR